jgi:hypothetical protein
MNTLFGIFLLDQHLHYLFAVPLCFLSLEQDPSDHGQWVTFYSAASPTADELDHFVKLKQPGRLGSLSIRSSS